MSTYTEVMDYSVHFLARVTHRLKIVEEADIQQNLNKFTLYIVRENSGAKINGGAEHMDIWFDNEKIYDGQFKTPALAAYNSDEVKVYEWSAPYTSSKKTFKVFVNYRCDKVEGGLTGLVAGWIWGTFATCEIEGNITSIDLSVPSISNISVKADRYGLNAFASFTASHASYSLYEITFKLSGLTYEQARHRRNTHANQRSNSDFNGAGHGQDYGSNEDGSYWFEIKLVYPIKQSTTVYLDLDDRPCDPPYALDSGASYPWELTVTAFNSKSVTRTGTLKVPQKVTGIDCESRLDINPGQNVKLDYSVYPSNAELLDVTFTSSNTQIATVDEDGTITGIEEGPCNITVKTVDGGYTATCLVYVLDSSVYPILEPLERYFKASHLNRMILATQFIRVEIEEKSGEVPDFEIIYFEGRAEKVLNIFPILRSFYANCNRLKSAASAIGVSVGDLPEIREIVKINAGWQIILNEWISFLNRLHEKINGD